MSKPQEFPSLKRHSLINALSNLEAQSSIQATAPDIAQRATAESKEQRVGENMLPASRDSEEEGRNTSSEAAYNDIGSRRDLDMASHDLEALNESKTSLNPQNTQDGQDTGHREGKRVRVVQPAKVHDHSLEKNDSESEPSLETVTPVDVQKQIDQLQRVFEENRDESQFEIDDFTQQLHGGRTESQWIFHRIRRSIVDVIITRATVACMLEDYKVMESHVLKAVETAIVLSQTSLYASLLKRCQYLKGVALFYQQRFEGADEAFANAGDCPAAPGISLRDAKEWRSVIKEALQASRPSSPAGPRENFDDPGSPSTPGTQMEPPSPFQSRKLANILEEVAAGEHNNNSANRTGESALQQVRQTLGKSPLIPQNNPSMYTPDRFQRKVSFAEPTGPRPSLRNSLAIKIAFRASRSRAMSNASMQEENILAAFGGGGRYQSPAASAQTPFQNRRMSWGSSVYEREEFTAGDEMSKKQWAAWDRMKRQEDALFKSDEMRFKSERRRKYEEKLKEKGVDRYERLRDSYRERVMEKSMIERGHKVEHVRKAQEKNRRRKEEQRKRREEQLKGDSS